MSFIPFVQPPPPSPRAHELAQRLKQTVDSFRQEHPSLTSGDVRQAMGMAARREGAGNVPVAVAIAVLLVMLGVLALLYFARVSGAISPNTMVFAVLSLGILIVVLKIFLRNR